MRKLINNLEGNPIKKKEIEILTRIKKLRSEKGLSQYHLGKRANETRFTTAYSAFFYF